MKRSFFISILFILAATIFISNSVFAQENDAMKNEHSYNQYLIEALQDTNMGVRFSAAKLLGERKCKHAKENLLDVLKNDQSYQNRIAAGLALMKIGDKNVLQVLKKQSEIDKRKTVRHVLRGIVREMNQADYLTLQ
ncbi:MAG: HEAT repeat domain-containing protein [Calditrichaeota bacterium]|nr:HEAT repeat domain-containing protein [Calditrichota bacterium]